MIRVDLPLPVEPITAVTSPGEESKDMCSSAGASALGKVNVTSRKETYPFIPVSVTAPSQSATTGTVSSTSLILPADTAALGYMTNIMDSIITDIIICITYWMTAMISPIGIAI